MSYAPITALVVLLCFFYAVFMLTLVPPLGSTTVVVYPVNSYYPNCDVVNIAVVNVLFFMVLVSFLRASFTDPGTVPAIHPWDPDCPSSYGASSTMEKALAEKGFQNIRGLERKMDGRARFCRMCGKYKPDRSHHSSNMGTCILEMDHYCPWIRNCVGYYNKKYFFLLVMYGSMTLIGYCISLGPRFTYACKHLHSALDFFIVLGWILALLMGTIVTCFAVFHIYLMSRAYTTIEFCEKYRADDSKVTSQGLRVRELYEYSPYDNGVYRNICHMLGPMYMWLIPSRYGMDEGIAAGCIFDVNPGHPLYINTIGAYRHKVANTTPNNDVESSLLENEDEDIFQQDKSVEAPVAPIL